MRERNLRRWALRKRALKAATTEDCVNCGTFADADGDGFDSTARAVSIAMTATLNVNPGAFGDGIDSDCDGGDGTCGDGVQQVVEECDDGNADDGDGCSAHAKVKYARVAPVGSMRRLRFATAMTTTVMAQPTKTRLTNVHKTSMALTRTSAQMVLRAHCVCR